MCEPQLIMVCFVVVSILHTSTAYISSSRSSSEQLFITRYWLATWIMWSRWGEIISVVFFGAYFMLCMYTCHVQKMVTV